MLLDGLNDMEVSKGVLGYLDTCQHLDEGPFFTTIIFNEDIYGTCKYTCYYNEDIEILSFKTCVLLFC